MRWFQASSTLRAIQLILQLLRKCGLSRGLKHGIVTTSRNWEKNTQIAIDSLVISKVHRKLKLVVFGFPTITFFCCFQPCSSVTYLSLPGKKKCEKCKITHHQENSIIKNTNMMYPNKISKVTYHAFLDLEQFSYEFSSNSNTYTM